MRFWALLVVLCGTAAPASPQANEHLDWTTPIAPFRIADNLYYVGSRDLASYLIVTPAGDILINSSLESSPALIRRSVEQLGLHFSDIHIVLISHAHFDHDAGSAEIKRMTGAQYMVMDSDVPVVESGGAKDFFYPDYPYPPAKVDRVLHDGDKVQLGGSVLVAHKTPGHTRGCTTWTMRTTQQGKPVNVVIVGSWNVNPGFRLVSRPGKPASYPSIADDCPAGSANAGSTILAGTPVPGNIISSIDPVAQKVLAADPEPNRPGFPNYVNQTPRVRDDNQFGVRVDHAFSANDQFFAHYLFSQSHITDPSAGYTSLPTFGAKIFYRGQNVSTSWVHSFGPSLLNEARLGFARNNPTLDCVECPRANGFLESFGIKNLRVQGTGLEEGFPYFAFANFAGVGDEGYVPVTNVEMVEKLEDNVTLTRGQHSVTLGVDLQDWQDLRQQNPYSPHGQFTFNGQYSSLAGAIPNVSGISDLADLELGYPAGAGSTRTYTDVNQVGGTFDSFYGQDDIKVSSSLNLNLGLRWEYRRPPVDKSNNIVQFIPTGPAFSGPGNGLLLTALPDAANDALCTNPADAYLISASGKCLVASSALRQQLGFAGRTRRTIMRPYYREFAPRFGLTWRPLASDKLIVRTGYGIFYDLGNLNILQFVSGNPIFSQKPVYNTAFAAPPPLTAGLPTTTENVFASPFVPPLSQQYAALWVPPDFQAPRIQMWSFGIQSQLAQNWALEVGYVGTKGNHLDNAHIFFNQPEPGVGNLQPRRPYPDFNVMAFFTPDDNSFYNALQMKLTKKFSNGFTFLTSYTYAKNLDDGGGNENYGEVPQDDNNRKANWARSTFDARQRLALSYIWQLPVGNGRKWLNQGGAVNAILGAWELTSVWSVQSGLPFTVSSPQDFSNTGSSSARPDRTCSGVGHKTVSNWFDAGCFTTTGLAQALANGQPRFGNSSRDILDAPGINSLDVALMKDFQFGERMKLQFRAESFNIFNQAHFGVPVATVGNPNIGQIGSAGDGRDIQFGMKAVF